MGASKKDNFILENGLSKKNPGQRPFFGSSIFGRAGPLYPQLRPHVRLVVSYELYLPGDFLNKKGSLIFAVTSHDDSLW